MKLPILYNREKKAKSVRCKIGDLRCKFGCYIRGLLNSRVEIVDSVGAYHLAKKSGWNKRCTKVSDFPNSMTNRMRMALTINYPAFHPAYFTRSGAKTQERAWKRTILANGKGISQILFRTEKVDYVWRLSTISEKIFRKIAFPFDLKPNFPDFLAKW